MSDLKQLGRDIAKLRKAERARTPQLPHTALEDAAFNAYVLVPNPNDPSELLPQLGAVIGRQFDGSIMAQTVSGPVPPVPLVANVQPAVGGLDIEVTGLFVGGESVVAPSDFARFEIHVSTDPSYASVLPPATTIETPRGGHALVAVAPGSYYVWVRTRTLSGKLSAPSAVAGPVSPASAGSTANSTIPGVPIWQSPFLHSTYEGGGAVRAQVQLDWLEPQNTDGSIIDDLAFWEIRYRIVAIPILRSASHVEMSAFSHQDLLTHRSPLPGGPTTVSSWQYARVALDVTSTLLQGLDPSTQYEFQVRGVDTGIPPNMGGWSLPATLVTSAGLSTPSTPAPPQVAGNPLAIMVQHTLGRAEGGTFNLPLDLHHLEVHAEYEPLFIPVSRPPTDGGTMIGKLMIGAGLINGQIPAIGSFSIANAGEVFVKVVAVNNAGKRSSASEPTKASATLVDSAHISELSATKITAGTIRSIVTISGSFRTGTTAGTNRSYMTGDNGFYCYNDKDELTFWAGGPNGYTTIRGRLETGGPNQARIVIDPEKNEQRFYPVAGSNQFFWLKAVYVDQPDDPTDAPGMELAGFNGEWGRVGGNLMMTEDAITLGIRKDTGNSDDGEWAGYHSIDSNGVHRFRGMFDASDAAGGQGALFVDRWDVAAGFGSLNINYGATMVTRMVTIATIYDGFGPPDAWAITREWNAGFTVAYTNARAVRVNYIAMRIP